MRIVHVLGLQRSGTNYLVELIRHNLPVNVLTSGDRSICWKHALPLDTGMNASHNYDSAEAAIKSRADVFVAVTSKHPVMWLSSILTGDKADLFMKRPELMVNDQPSLGRLAALYRDFYDGWREVLERRGGFAVVPYEAALVDPADVLGAFSDALGVSRTEEIVIPSRVPYSKRFGPVDRERYMAFKDGLTAEQREEFTTDLGPSVLAGLGYAIDPESRRALAPTFSGIKWR